ncbi:MAG: class I SAM-dependent methyltransferase [Bacteroidota bacterium]|nr:class I SAM-dependent methyltransferase [Bacteroidota bacterium]
MEAKISPQDIVNYYDTCEVDYRWLWHLNELSAMHYGLWWDDTTHLKEALKNMNDYVLNKVALQDDLKILDAGCGVGGTSIYAAKNYKCDLFGITLSEKQVATAKEKATQNELLGNVHFSVQNYCKTNFENESFDAIYAIESVCHAEEKEAFVKESFRLLKNGGRLVIADFFKSRNELPAQHEKLLKNWAHSWAVPSFISFNKFIEFAEEAGLSILEDNNISPLIHKSARRLYLYFIPGIISHWFLRLLGLRNRIHGTNVWSTYYQYIGLKKGLWQYHVLKFIKK